MAQKKATFQADAEYDYASFIMITAALMQLQNVRPCPWTTHPLRSLPSGITGGPIWDHHDEYLLNDNCAQCTKG